MENRHMLRQKGFTLMELMITMAIIGIIAAVAYPSYIKSAYKGRRAEGKAALNLAAQTLERCYANYGLYNSGNCGEVATLASGTASQPHQYYTITTSSISGTAYTIQAKAVSSGPQAKDTGCTTFTLNSNGQQGSGASTTSDAGSCW